MNIKLLENGIMPTRAHFDDAGIDLYTPSEFTLLPGMSQVVNTKVAVQIPIGYFGKIESKSGLNVRHNIQSAGGVIDSGYRGSIQVRITNNGQVPYTFERGDKLCQMVLIPVGLFDLTQVDELDVSESGRDNKGFGSTGR
ncbi:MAG: dUTP diphosphatase [Firmicutes bacterium]|nr:dUTP diphosphatase [Bacillota bacterium]